jgi:hypothetical protein
MLLAHGQLMVYGPSDSPFGAQKVRLRGLAVDWAMKRRTRKVGVRFVV